MAYAIVNPVLGFPKIASTSTAPWQGGQSSQLPPLGMKVQAVDPVYGVGEFIFLSGVASTVVGSWVTYNTDDYTTKLTVADDIGPVAVAMSINVALQYGWYQIAGKAIGLTSAAVPDNANVYTTATPGAVDDTVVAGERIYNAKAAQVFGSATTGEFEIAHPWIQNTAAD